jgi:hypothetical protein
MRKFLLRGEFKRFKIPIAIGMKGFKLLTKETNLNH